MISASAAVACCDLFLEPRRACQEHTSFRAKLKNCQPVSVSCHAVLACHNLRCHFRYEPSCKRVIYGSAPSPPGWPPLFFQAHNYRQRSSPNGETNQLILSVRKTLKICPPNGKFENASPTLACHQLNKICSSHFPLLVISCLPNHLRLHRCGEGGPRFWFQTPAQQCSSLAHTTDPHFP